MEAFEAKGNIEEALAAYEAARKSAVENLLSATERSRIHFEHLQRVYDMSVRRFVLKHITRAVV
jgi:ActR/RegA family two-component response regulator